AHRSPPLKKALNCGLFGVYREPPCECVRAACDEALIHVLPVQISAADRVVGVRPVDVATVDGHPVRARGGGDEALIDVLPVRVGAADRAATLIRPVDVAPVDRYPVGARG